MKKKLILLIAILLLLTACGSSKEASSQEVWIDVNEIYNLTLDQAKEKFGELTNQGEYLDDKGNENIIYTTSDNRYEFYFSPDGTKLHALYIYGKDDEFTLNSQKDIANALNLVLGADAKSNKEGGARFYNIDETNYVAEIYLMNSEFTYPMKTNLIQIWFK